MHTNQSSFYGNGRRGVDKRKLSFVFMALTVLFTVGAMSALSPRASPAARYIINI